MTEEKQPLYKKKWFVTLAIFSIFLVANVIYSAALGHGGIPNFSVIEDADKTDRGTYMLCDTTFRSMSDRSGVGPYRNRVIEVNKEGEVIWETTGFAGLHEIEYLPNGHLLIADTQNNRVVEINYPDKTEGWDWNPNKINWTEVNPKWGADHYYNNEKSFDWSHLNDVDFKSYPTWDACLISMRNFDLIVEVNFTAEMENPYQAENIVWYYGDHEDYSLMNHQHNPDYLPNGNIIVVDSQNQRVIEINKTTKEQVWEYDKIRGWCRDADPLPNGNILIAESFSVYAIN